MRSIGSFNLKLRSLNIPIKIYSAIRENKEFSLNLLNPNTKNKIKLLKVDSITNDEVYNTIKGYNIGTDKKPNFLIFNNDEIENLEAINDKTINIIGITSREYLNKLNVFPLKQYYIEAEQNKDIRDTKNYKLYFLIHQLLKNIQPNDFNVLIAKIVIRSKENLCIIFPFDNILILTTIAYKEQFNDYGNLKTLPFELTTKEYQLLESLKFDLINNLPFEYDKLKDNYTDKMRDIINKKVENPNYIINFKIDTEIKNDDINELLELSIL